MGKLSNTWNLMMASLEILKKDKELIFFPIFSGIALLLVLASFALPIFFLDVAFFNNTAENQQSTMMYIIGFLFYFVNYFIIIFFNSALIGCATIRLNGGDLTVMDGLKIAVSRLFQILGWSLLSATVGIILRTIGERSGLVGKIVVALLGAAWTITSFLVVPVLVVEEKGPIEAYKSSVQLLKKTWGEQLLSNLGFGIIFFILIFVPTAIGIAVIATLNVPPAILAILGGLAAIYFISLTLIQTTLQGIFQAALYHFAKKGEAPEGFSEEQLGHSFGRR